MVALLLALGLAHAADPLADASDPSEASAESEKSGVRWDLSQRWRHTQLHVLTESIQDGAIQGQVGGVAYEARYDPGWFQRTRFSATIADKHAVRVMIGTDADFKDLRQLAATYLNEAWMIGYERGAFEQRITVSNPRQVSVPRAYNELLMPEDTTSTRSYSALTLKHWLGPETPFIYVGATWTTLTNPQRISHGYEEVTDERRTVLDDNTRTDLLGPVFDADFTRQAIAKGCKKATLCLRPAWEVTIYLGASRTIASKEAAERYVAAQHQWDPDTQDQAQAVWGFSNSISQSLGLLWLIDLGNGNAIAIEPGYSGQSLGVIGFGGSDRTNYLPITGNDGVGGVNQYVFHGPHVEAYTRF